MPTDGTASTPREVIEKIRSESFLLDLDGLPAHVQAGARSLQAKLNSALKLLSEDLYQTKTHFVLELIQNADDNTYPSGAIPHLTFHISPERLVATNNEVGFSEKNVIALCSVGESSKSANKVGYIGEKGIGFKSVFSVSEAPEIHSNGYHFKFDRSNKDNLLGFVVPTWHSANESIQHELTTIVLPASPEHSFSTSDFDGLNAEILLFLNKLRHLTFSYTKEEVKYLREDKGQITHIWSERTGDVDNENTGTSYLRFERTLQISDENRDAKRPGVLATSIVLAFPLDSNGKAAPQRESNIFAFLPIRPEGFSFSIQADFILNSSREEVFVDRQWNKILRDEIANAFAEAVEEFKKTPELSLTYLTFIPSEAEIRSAFFKPIAKCVIELLSQMQCVFSASGTWKKPSELWEAVDTFRELFPSEISIALFGYDYIDARVKRTQEITKKLGVKNLTYTHILEIFSKHGQWLQQQPLSWRAKFYAFIASNRDKLIEFKLLDCPCVPSSKNTLLTPSKSEFFFPLSESMTYGFEHELTFIDNELYQEALRISPDVAKLFSAFGVRTDNPYDLLKSHILPRHKGEEWKGGGHVALIGHLRYVKDKLSQFIEIASANGMNELAALKTIREGIWVGTKSSEGNSWTFGRADALYLSSSYEPNFCIETLLAGEIDRAILVSPSYLATSRTDTTHSEELTSWRNFFVRLGIRQSPGITKDGNDSKCSTELLALLQSPKSEVCRATLECMDQNWSYYSSHLSFVAPNARPAIPTPTTFKQSLRSTAAPSNKRNATALSESYYPTDEIIALIGDSVTYVEATLSEPILTACGVTFQITSTTLLSRLKYLKDNGGDTGKQLQKIYREFDSRLWDHDAQQIRKAFYADGLVRVKGHHKTWAKPSDVAWRSNGHFIDSIFPPLATQYTDFSRFFLERLGVQTELPTEKYVEALRHLNEIPNAVDRQREAMSIYRKASRDLTYKLGSDAPPPPDWLEIFQHEAIFLTHRSTIRPKHKLLYANDAPEIASLFQDEEDIDLLTAQPNEVPRLARLLDECGIQYLSKSVNMKICGITAQDFDIELTERVRNAYLYFARVLYSKNSLAFDEALKAGHFGTIKHINVCKVKGLSLLVTLGPSFRTVESQIAYEQGTIFYRIGCVSIRDRLSAELCKILGAPNDMVDTFARILSEESHSSVEEFLDIRAISQLPSDLFSMVSGRKETAAPENTGSEQTAAVFDEQQDTEGTGNSIESRAVRTSPPTTPVTESQAGQRATSEDLNAARPKDTPDSTQNEKAQSTSTALPPTAGNSDAVPKKDSLTRSRQSNFHQWIRRNAGESYRNPAKSQQPPSLDSNTLPNSPSHLTPSTGTSAALRNFQIAPRLKTAGWRGTRQHRHRSGRLLSYAVWDTGPANSLSLAEVEQRVLVENSAVKYFLQSNAINWSSLEQMPGNNQGYDIKGRTFDGIEEWIEVKGQSSAWTEEGIILTPAELQAAANMGDKYLLYVVEYALDDSKRKAHLIRDPYNKTREFRFDSGWKSISTHTKQSELLPRPGIYIDLPIVGKGCIVATTRKGRFFTVKVKLTAGEIVSRIYNPSKMRLSEEQQCLE